MNDKLLEIMSPFLETFSNCCVPLILILFFLWVILFFLKFVEQRNFFRKVIDKISDPENPPIRYSDELETLSDPIYNTEHNNLISAWIIFEKSLYKSVDTDTGKERVYVTEPIRYFFTEDTLFIGVLNLRFWNSVPALLVGIGILGTFAGLALGVSNLGSMDLESLKIGNQMPKEMQDLLDGMSAAFISSIVGMSTSLLFSGLEKYCIHILSKLITEFQNTLGVRFESKS